MAAFKIWVQAARPRTLPLALAGLLLGNLLAASQQQFSISIAVLSIITASLLQILSNYANDYGDYVNGADNAERIGPKRAVQSGAISQQNMKIAIAILGFSVLVFGALLLWQAKENINALALLTMFSLGILAIIAAYKYTASTNPYGYNGYGDIAVFAFFGILAVCGIFFLQTGQISHESVFYGSAFGTLSTGVLNLNNMRDIENDAKAGKKTVAVMLGLASAKKYHYLLIAIAIIIFVLFAVLKFQNVFQYLFLTPLILLIIHCIKVKKRTSYAEFNPLLKELSLSSALMAISFGTALAI